MSVHIHESPFYGYEILRKKQEELIKKVLMKYQDEKADEELKKKVYDELTNEKYQGNITIPFRVILRNDVHGVYPPCIEVILDTKV